MSSCLPEELVGRLLFAFSSLRANEVHAPKSFDEDGIAGAASVSGRVRRMLFTARVRATDLIVWAILASTVGLRRVPIGSLAEKMLNMLYHRRTGRGVEVSFS